MFQTFKQFTSGKPFTSDHINAYKVQQDAAAGKAAANAQTLAAANQASGLMGSTLYQQPANFANSFADVYKSYSGGLGNVATAMANERGNLYGANAMAEAARQGAVSNIGSAALGAFGGIGNSALAAWATNQTAYNKALSDMHTANQAAMSNYGQSRNAALGQLGGAYAQTASGLGAAGRRDSVSADLGGLFGGGGGFGGDGFTASGPGGTIASGSYGGGGLTGGGGAGGFGINRSSDNPYIPGLANAAFGGLGGLSKNLMDWDLPNRMDRRADQGAMQLDAQHYSSRMMPSQMMGQALSGLMALGGQAYGNSSMGMDQFYGNQQRAGDQFMTGVTGKGGILDRLSSGFGDSNTQINAMWDRTLGKTAFRTPEEQVRDAEAARQARRQVDAIAAQNPAFQPTRAPVYTRVT